MRLTKLLVLCACFCAISPLAFAQGNQGAGKKCGSFGWNLEGCDCKGATGSCSIDPGGQGCSASNVPAGVYPIAYTNIGRCDSDCPAGGIGRGGRSSGEGGWNEKWINLKSGPGKARTQRLIEQAAQKGFKAIEPDNTAESVDTQDLLFIVQTAAHYQMKVAIKNDEGTWKQFLAQYPQYKQNIHMVLAEDCNSTGACMHYKHFKDMGIPVVITGQNAGALQSLAKQIPAAGMVVPAKNAVGKTTIGEPPCIDQTPPKQEQKPSSTGDYTGQSQGQQPYQQTPTSQPSPQTGGGPAGNPTGVQSGNYNPGANKWNKNDFDRLQKDAKPSFLDPNKPLPKEGDKNPFAKDTDWKEEKKKAETKKKEPGTEPTGTKKTEATTFYDPLGGASTPVKEKNTTDSENKTIVKTFGSAKIRCSPKTVLRGVRPTVSWNCGDGADSAKGIGFNARNAVKSSVQTFPIKDTTYAIQCYSGAELVGSALCVVKVRTEKPADASFSTGEAKSTSETKNPSLCFLSFCL